MRWAVFVVLLSLTAGVFAQEVTDKEMKAAVKKGCDWLISQQGSEGQWLYNTQGPFVLQVDPPIYDGSTALVLFALLKGGVDPEHPAIKKGFAYLEKLPYKYTYAVSCYILALDALYEALAKKRAGKKARKEHKHEKGMTRVVDIDKYDPAKDMKRWNPADVKKLKELIDWLVANRTNGRVWRYPPNGEDASNTQYAILALSVALRRRIPVPDEVYNNIAKYFVECQEKDGPEVDWFPVPAADKSFRELRKVERDLVKRVTKMERELKKVGIKEDRDKIRTTVVRQSQDQIFKGEKKKMYARGWCYMYNDTQGAAWRKMITGAMTTSGVAALCVCKRALEGRPAWRALQKRVNQAIRDGAAWLAHHFTVSNNPVGKMYPGGKDGQDANRGALHHYYYLYGLERVGILGLIPRLGKHDWYTEGARHLMSAQRPDGSWEAGSGTSGPIPDTCWAILFLKKATTPLVRIPKDIYSGKGILGK